MPLYVLVPVYATTADENKHSMKRERLATLLVKGKRKTATNNFKGEHRFYFHRFFDQAQFFIKKRRFFEGLN